MLILESWPSCWCIITEYQGRSYYISVPQMGPFFGYSPFRWPDSLSVPRKPVSMEKFDWPRDRVADEVIIFDQGLLYYTLTSGSNFWKLLALLIEECKNLQLSNCEFYKSIKPS